MGSRSLLCTAFEGPRRVASGELGQVAATVKTIVDAGGQDPVLIFGEADGRPVEVDLRGTVDDVLARLADTPAAPALDLAEVDRAEAAPRGRGRPRLGVVAREVTLLQRHWEWLGSRPGGASVALRRLVDEARQANEDKDRVRQAQEAAYRFMTVMAGNLPGYEEAMRTLYARDRARFDETTLSWPADVRDHAGKLAAAAFETATGAG